MNESTNLSNPDNKQTPTPMLLVIILFFTGFSFLFLPLLFLIEPNFKSVIDELFFNVSPIQSRHSILPLIIYIPLLMIFFIGTIKRKFAGWWALVFCEISKIISNLVGIIQILLWNIITPELGFIYTDASKDALFLFARMMISVIFVVYFNSSEVTRYYSIERSRLSIAYLRMIVITGTIHFIILVLSPTVTRLPLE